MSSDLHQCPNCGAYVMSGNSICPRCDFDFEAAEASDQALRAELPTDVIPPVSAAPDAEITPDDVLSAEEPDAHPDDVQPILPLSEEALNAPVDPASPAAEEDVPKGEPDLDPPVDLGPVTPATGSKVRRTPPSVRPMFANDVPTPKSEPAPAEKVAELEPEAEPEPEPASDTVSHIRADEEPSDAAEESEGEQAEEPSAELESEAELEPEPESEQEHEVAASIEVDPDADTGPGPYATPQAVPVPDADDVAPEVDPEATLSGSTPRRSPEPPDVVIPPAPFTPPPARIQPPPPPSYAPAPGYGYGALPGAVEYLQQRVHAYRNGGYTVITHAPHEATLATGKGLSVGTWLLALVTLVGVLWYALVLAVSGFGRDVVYLVLESDGRVYEDGPGAAHVRHSRSRAGRRWALFGLLMFVVSLLLALILGAVAGVVLTQERYQAALREAYPAVTLFEEQFSTATANPDDVDLAQTGGVVFAITSGIALVGLWGGATLFIIGTVHASAYRVYVPALPGYA